MKVASVTVSAITHGFRRGFQAAAETECGFGRDSAVVALMSEQSLDRSGTQFDAENAR
jgi:hypothetical protein